MIDIFLKAKHWQLFLLVVGVPIIFQFVFMGYFFGIFLHTQEQPDPSSIMSMFILFPLLGIITGGVLFGWQWSIAIGLQKLVPENVSMKITRFKVFFFIPIVYMICILLFMMIFMSGIISGLPEQTDPPLEAIFGAMFLIVPLHLFSMFCIFYVMYFVAKTLKTVELQRKVSFGDFAGEFFLIWFNFIGFWILQPRINRLYNGEGINFDET